MDSNQAPVTRDESGLDDHKYDHWSKVGDILRLLEDLPRDKKRQLLDAVSGTIGFKLVARGINTVGIPTTISETITPPVGRGGPSKSGGSVKRPTPQQSPYGNDSRLMELKKRELALVKKLQSNLNVEDQAATRQELEVTRNSVRLRKSEINPSFRGSTTKSGGEQVSLSSA